MAQLQSIFFICVMVFPGFGLSLSWSQDSIPRHAPNTLPGVEPEMLMPEYWIELQDDADEVLMTPEQIEQFNEKVRTKKVVFRDYYGKPDPLEQQFEITQNKGPVMNPLLPLDLPDMLTGDSLMVRLKTNIEWLYSRDFYNERYDIYHDGMKQEIVEDMNVEGIPDVTIRRFGIIVKHANVRHYPTPVPGFGGPRSKMDLFQATALLIGNPVAIIHQTPDGGFLYVESPISRGWIAAEDIAISDRESIREITGDRNFLLATGDRVPVYGDPECKNLSRYFYFSATMPLLSHDSKGYVVKMPYRKPDGFLGVARGYIKSDADVHVGYLPYTKRNVLIQIFKLLNTPYGWADQFNKRDCSGTMRVLLRCFGIRTGRHPSFILSASDHQVYIDPTRSTEEKIQEAAKIEPVITMAGNSGHIVLFLGRARNGKLYFMHQGGFGYRDEHGERLIVGRVSINPVDHTWYHINNANVFTTFKF